MLTVAPEREEELREIMEKDSVEHKEVGRKSFTFAADTVENNILYSVVGLEFLWAASYTYWVLYQKAQDASKRGDDEIFFDDHPDLQNAVELYEWALNKCLNQASKQWPQHLPSPSNNPVCGSHEHAATELAACAAGWILHHELAHIRLDHSATTVGATAKREEKEADECATEWVMSKVRDPKKKQKRALGIAVGLLVIVSIDLGRGSFTSQSHPESFKRLHEALSGLNLGPNHEVYSFACLMMKLNVSRSNLAVEITEYQDTFSDYLDELTFLLSRNS
jgi:hypothetical protein